MSQEQANETQATEELSARANYLLLDVDEIHLPEISNVRPFSSKQDGEKEIAKIQQLMLSIEQEGQIQPIVVVPLKDAKPEDRLQYDLIVGRRRLRAIQMHNLASDQPLKIKAILGDAVKSGAQLFRRALHENTQREDINAIDFAGNIKEVRKNKKWTQAKDTVKVAEFFGCSEAQITQHEKLLGLEEEFQQAMVDGKLTREGAYALLKVKKEKRKVVYDAAMGKQKRELGEAAILEADQRQGYKDANLDSTKAKKSGAAKAGGVKAKHVKAAAREADPESKQSHSMKDWIEWLEGCQGPAYGHANGAVWVFVDKFKEWRKGTLSDRTLFKYWDAMVEKAPRGAAPVEAPKPKK
jgi:ParB/RepB/Spo0J family partition protein